MFELFIAVFGVGLILLVGEFLWRLKITKGEYARKFVHILTAIFASTWIFYMDSQMIILACMIFVFGVIFFNKFKIFPSIHSIKRATYGEIWFPLGIGITALIFSNPYIYAIAVLHMGVADGMAAVIGVSLGKKAGIFKVMGNTKSIAGSLSFFIISFSLFVLYWQEYTAVPVFYDNQVQAILVSLSSAFIATVVELVSPKGSDNIFLPITAGVLAIIPTFQIFF